MKYTVRPSTIRDLIQLERNSTENVKVDKDTIEQSDELRTFVYDGKPLAMIGLQSQQAENHIDAAVWAIFDKDIDKHSVALVRFCKDLIFDRCGYKFYALIDEREEKFVRFVRHFGFVGTKHIEKIGDILYRIYEKEN